MSNLDQVWGATSADSNTDENPPPAGYVGVPRVAGTRAGVSKKGEQYLAIDLADDQAGYRWTIYKQFTKGGQPHDGSIKSAKITLRQLGLDVPAPAQLGPMLKTIEGRYFSVEHVASDRVNPNTGAFYLNTNVTGPASAPTLNVAPAPAQPVQAQPVPQQQPQAGTVQFPAAVPGQPPTVVGQQAPAAAMQQQVQQAVAQVDDNPGW